MPLVRNDTRNPGLGAGVRIGRKDCVLLVPDKKQHLKQETGSETTTMRIAWIARRTQCSGGVAGRSFCDSSASGAARGEGG